MHGLKVNSVSAVIMYLNTIDSVPFLFVKFHCRLTAVLERSYPCDADS